MADPVYLTINEFPGTGAPAPTVVDFAFAGGYISPAHVKAELFDPVTYSRTPVAVTDEHFVTDYRLSLPVSVPAGIVLRVYRDTPKDQPLVNFTNGARIAENNLDLVAEQAVFVAAEAADQIAATQIDDVLQAVEAAAAAANGAEAAAEAAAAAAALEADRALGVRGDLATTGTGKGAEMVAFKQAGIGALARTTAEKLRESVSVKDFGTVDAAAFAAAASDAGGRVVVVPVAGDDTALPSDYSSTLFEYNGTRPVRTTHSSTSVGTAKKALKGQFQSSHVGALESAFHIETQARGSGQNGPDSADYGQTIAIHKKGYAGVSDPPAGEIDGLSIFVRQDGPKGQPSGGANSSDASGILVNIQNVEDVGFTSAWESSTSNYDRGTAQITRAVQTQIGAIDANQVGAPSYGYVAVSTTGTNTHAYYAGANGGASWTNLFHSPNALTIDNKGNYRAPTTDWSGGSWSIVRGAGANGSTQITHRGTGALFLYAQDAGAIQFGTNGAIRWQLNSAGNFTPVTNLQGDMGGASARVSEVWASRIDLGSTSSNGIKIDKGTGSPEGVITARVGSLYLRTDGGAGTTLYVKESGTGNTGWVAK